jgi:hypothetical protein
MMVASIMSATHEGRRQPAQEIARWLGLQSPMWRVIATEFSRLTADA